jgi:hypothetical protein
MQTPLASISDLAHRTAGDGSRRAAEREVSAIGAGAAKASGMVSRLVWFAAAEQVEARQADISARCDTRLAYLRTEREKMGHLLESEDL